MSQIEILEMELEYMSLHCKKCNTLETKKINVYKSSKNSIKNTSTTNIKTKLPKSESIRLHLLLLIHSTNCNDCKSINCKKMKQYITHSNECHHKSCLTCSRVKNMLDLHSKACNNNNCNVKNCNLLKTKYLQEKIETDV